MIAMFPFLSYVGMVFRLAAPWAAGALLSTMNLISITREKNPHFLLHLFAFKITLASPVLF